MTAPTMAGEWPANIGWRAAGRKGRRHRPDKEEVLRWALMARHGQGKGHGHGRGPLDREDLERMAVLRHLRGGGRGGPPFGGGRGRGRRRRGDVRAALLMLLAEEPMNGYQLMQTIEQRSDGRWRPSPGSVYPSLAQLEDEGFIRSIERDGTKLFEITDAGREHLASRHEQRAPWDLGDDPAGESPHDLRSMIPDIAAAIWQVSQVGDEAQMRRASELLAETRRSLYRILAEDDPESAAQDDPESAAQDDPESAAEADSDEPDVSDERVPSGDDE